MNEKEALIRERRTFKAIENNLMGAPGKLGTIVKYLGQPIESEDGAMFQSLPMGDPWSLEDPHAEYDPMKMHDWSDETRVSTLGWVFDGLSRGMHIEIKYIEFKAELTVSYKGYPVYAEVAGQLEGYAPFPEWEELIERLFVTADKLKQQALKEERVMMRREADQEARGFLHKLRMRWGF